MQAFASSLAADKCSVEAFVGRTTKNCRTEDEPYSFFGVDLGQDRRLLPSYYTLRNRSANTHVVRNWYFEASVTGANWVILDARIYQSDDALDNEFKDFCKPGGTVTL